MCSKALLLFTAHGLAKLAVKLAGPEEQNGDKWFGQQLDLKKICTALLISTSKEEFHIKHLQSGCLESYEIRLLAIRLHYFEK